jgi:hypothetical protein
MKRGKMVRHWTLEISLGLGNDLDRPSSGGRPKHPKASTKESPKNEEGLINAIAAPLVDPFPRVGP